MKTILLTIGVVVMITLDCKNDEPEYKVPSADITGQWDWISTYWDGPISDSNPLTPLNTGIHELVTFSVNHTWSVYQNSIQVDSGLYEIGHGIYIPYPGAGVFEYDSIAYYKNGKLVNGGPDFYVIFNDTLQFSPGFGGRYSSYTLPYNGSKFWIRR